MTNTAEKNKNTLNPELVSEFLIENPNFLFENSELLSEINIKHLNDSSTVSLIEKQVELLRDKNSCLQIKLDELVAIARENEQLSNHLHSLASNLLEARSISDVLAITEDMMRDVFKVDFVAMRMLSDVTDDMLLLIDEQTENDLFAEFFTYNQALCGNISPKYIHYFFEDNKNSIHSAALLPLKSVNNLGVLALGSADASRFNNDMGLLFLSHISDLVSSALVSHLQA